MLPEQLNRLAAVRAKIDARARYEQAAKDKDPGALNALCYQYPAEPECQAAKGVSQQADLSEAKQYGIAPAEQVAALDPPQLANLRAVRIKIEFRARYEQLKRDGDPEALNSLCSQYPNEPECQAAKDEQRATEAAAAEAPQKGVEYARTSGTSWELLRKTNEMTDKIDLSVRSI